MTGRRTDTKERKRTEGDKGSGKGRKLGKQVRQRRRRENKKLKRRRGENLTEGCKRQPEREKIKRGGEGI